VPRPQPRPARPGASWRPVTDDDLPFLAELYASTRREEVAQPGWPAETQEAFLRQQHEAQHRHYTLHYAAAEWLVIERGGEAVGRLCLLDKPDELHIIDISLLPHARGQGLGGAILEDILDAARELGKGVAIHVEMNNPALSLYRRLGFEAVGDAGIHYLMRAVPPS
jgi:ribosomal protein S18 acetylase RimI-like enzyme